MNVPSGSKPSFTCPSPSASEVMRSLHMKEGPSVCGAQSTLVFYEGPHLAVHRISDLTDKQDVHPIHFCRHFNLAVVQSYPKSDGNIISSPLEL